MIDDLVVKEPSALSYSEAVARGFHNALRGRNFFIVSWRYAHFHAVVLSPDGQSIALDAMRRLFGRAFHV